MSRAIPSRVRCLAWAGLLACAPVAARAAGDPFEAVNRRIFGFNSAVQARVLGPLAEGYLAATTPSVRRGIVTCSPICASP